MADSTSTRTSVPLLLDSADGSKVAYASWVFEMEAFLTIYGLYDLISTESDSIAVITAETYDLRGKNRMLHAYLVMACKSTESMTVLRSVAKGDGREAWSKLQKYYEDGSMFTKINSQIQMFNHTLQAKG